MTTPHHNQAYLADQRAYDEEKFGGNQVYEKEDSYQYGVEDVGAPVHQGEETHRSLKPRQISMIAIGGAIGEFVRPRHRSPLPTPRAMDESRRRAPPVRSRPAAALRRRGDTWGVCLRFPRMPVSARWPRDADRRPMCGLQRCQADAHLVGGGLIWDARLPRWRRQRASRGRVVRASVRLSAPGMHLQGDARILPLRLSWASGLWQSGMWICCSCMHAHLVPHRRPGSAATSHDLIPPPCALAVPTSRTSAVM